MGMMMFWAVLSIAALALAVVTRVYPLTLSALGMAGAAFMAWQSLALLYQFGLALSLLGVAVFFWIKQTRPQPVHQLEAGPSRLSNLGALSNFSAFSDEADEVTVERWDTGGTTNVLFHGRNWKARLAKGAKAHPGLYKVREVRDGLLVLEEVMY